MSQQGKILIVDDEEFHLELLKDVLAQDYHLTLVNSGQEALECLNQEHFDLALLDVKMPNMDGYQLCREIRNLPNYDHLPVIFVSALSTDEERIEGYEAGGDDYILKPFQQKEILTKVDHVLEVETERHQLKDKLTDATKTAMEAMSGNSEMGTALLFVERAHDIHSGKDLANLMNEACLSLGLVSTVYLPNAIGEQYFGAADANVSPLERELMETLRDKERIFNFDQRSQFNFSEICVLIKNMPIEDEHKYGRYKDLLPLIIGAVNAQVRSVLAQQTINQHDLVKRVINEVQLELDGLGQRVHDNQQQFDQVVGNLKAAIEKEIPNMGLEVDQENLLFKLIDTKLQLSQALTENNRQIVDTCDRINEVLRKIVG